MEPVPARLAAWLRRRGWALLLVVAYLYSFPWYERIHSANELPRAYLVMAMVDHGSFRIDDGVRRWGVTADVSRARLLLRDVDRVTSVHGRVRHGSAVGAHYSNKAPGSSMLAIPGYLLLKGWHAVAGGAPSLAEVVWMSRVTTGIIPSLLFLWLLWGFLARFTPSVGARRLTVLTLGVGSMFFLYSILFISHPLAAVAIGAAWIVAVGAIEAERWSMMAVAGLLAGCAPLVDYQAAFAGVPVAIWVVVGAWRRGYALRAVAWAAAGAALPIAILLYYHWACFGSPWLTGYEASDTFAQFHQKGFLGMDKLRWEAFTGSMIAPTNGLLFFWPAALLAIPGWVLMARDRALRGHAAVTLSVAVIYILFISALNFWRGGWQVGPRYTMAMLPFLAPPIAVALAAAERRWWLRGGAAGLIGVGLVIYGLTAALFPYFPDTKFRNPVHEITLRLLVDGHAPWNLGWLVGLRGLASMVPYLLVLAALAAGAMVPSGGAWRAAWRSSWRGVAAAVAITVAILVAYRAIPGGGRAADESYRRTIVGAM
ncbi:MAG: hypothetical protein KC464_09405, partial [Myxococcales bacterium]|nr:hypothetical protein [Myxococcales bacterium]